MSSSGGTTLESEAPSIMAHQADPDRHLGAGPGLTSPHDAIQNSERAEKNHLDKVANTVGPGPGQAQAKKSDHEVVHLENSETIPLSGNLHLASTASVTTRKTRKSGTEIGHQQTLSSIREKIGLEKESPVLDDHHSHANLTWSSVRIVFREPFAEFFGTFVMILFGNGSVAQVLLSTGQASAPGGNGFGQYQSISWGWGLGVMLGIYVAGDSGAFLNPAITFNFCLFRKLPWRRFPIYFVAQVLGAFCASGVVYANYINAINNFEGHGIRTVPPNETASAGIFCTYPQAFMTKAGEFFSEFIASTILMFVIFALKDDSNPGAMGKSGAGQFFPLALFFLIFGLGACFGWQTGYAINLARDFGPRLMSFVLGYGHEVWSAGGYYFWIPMVAPFLGCTFGGFLYDLFIYTGPESPINMPWFGLKYLFTGGYWRKKRDHEKYDV